MKAWLSIAAIVAGYLALQLFVLRPDGFLTGDQGPKYLQAAAFAAQGPFSPNIEVLSRDVDPGYEFQDPILHRRGPHLVSAFSWLLPILTAPFLALLGARGLYVIPAVSVVVVFLLGRSLGRAMGLGSGVSSGWAAAAATPMLFFGGELWEHAPAAAAAMATAVLLAPRPGDSAALGRFAAAGACGAIAALFREEGGLALPSFLVARALVAGRDARIVRTTGAALLGAAVIVVMSIPLNLTTYGSALPLHLSSEIEKTGNYVATRMDAVRDLVLPSPGAALFVAVVVATLVALAASRRKTPAVRVTVATIGAAVILGSMAAVPLFRLATGTPQPFAGFTMSSAAHTWIFAIALLYLMVMPRQPALPRYLLVGSSLLIAGTLAIVPSSGGAQWSPRYLACAAPLLAVVATLPIGSAAIFPRAAALQARWVTIGLLALSFVVQLEGIYALARTKRINGAVMDRTAEATTSGGIVIATLPWFPEVNAPLLASRRILFAASPDRVRAAVARAEAAGIRDVGIVTGPGDGAASGMVSERCRASGEAPIALGRGLELHRFRCGM